MSGVRREKTQSQHLVDTARFKDSLEACIHAHRFILPKQAFAPVQKCITRLELQSFRALVASQPKDVASNLLWEIISALHVSGEAKKLREQERWVIAHYEDRIQCVDKLIDSFEKAPDAAQLLGSVSSEYIEYDKKIRNLLSSLDFARADLVSHLNDAQTFFSKPPRTRKHQADSVHRTTFMVLVSRAMKQILGKWHDEEVAALTRTYFSDAADIGGNAVRKARRRRA
jgi:hypothetical protein